MTRVLPVRDTRKDLGKRSEASVKTGHVTIATGHRQPPEAGEALLWDRGISSGGSRLVASEKIEELVAFRPLGMESFVMVSTRSS